MSKPRGTNRRTPGTPEPLPFGSDPVDSLVGMFNGGPDDESVNHDHYLYGWPKVEPTDGQ